MSPARVAMYYVCNSHILCLSLLAQRSIVWSSPSPVLFLSAPTTLCEHVVTSGTSPRVTGPYHIGRLGATEPRSRVFPESPRCAELGSSAFTDPLRHLVFPNDLSSNRISSSSSWTSLASSSALRRFCLDSGCSSREGFSERVKLVPTLDLEKKTF